MYEQTLLLYQSCGTQSEVRSCEGEGEGGGGSGGRGRGEVRITGG